MLWVKLIEMTQKIIYKSETDERLTHRIHRNSGKRQ